MHWGSLHREEKERLHLPEHSPNYNTHVGEEVEVLRSLEKRSCKATRIQFFTEKCIPLSVASLHACKDCTQGNFLSSSHVAQQQSRSRNCYSLLSLLSFQSPVCKCCTPGQICMPIGAWVAVLFSFCTSTIETKELRCYYVYCACARLWRSPLAKTQKLL